MNCIAIDDEPLALNVISDYCSKIEFLTLLGTCTSAVEAVKLLNQHRVDLIFLDIQMPHISGLEFIKTLTNPPLVVFTTAYSEHALEGYELNAIDYLLKPIPFDRFFQAVNKAYNLYNLRNRTPQTYIADYNHPQDPDYIMIKVEYSTVKINLSEITYIEGLKDYVKIYMGPKPVLTKSTMKNMEEKLPSGKFIRVHKSFIISVLHIKAIENNRIIIGEKYIPIGNQYKQHFYDELKKHSL